MHSLDKFAIVVDDPHRVGEEEENKEERSMGILFPENLTTKDLYVSESFDCFDAIGNGMVQKRMLVITTICVYIAAANMHIVPFISTDVGHWCKRPPHSNISEADWRNAAIPLDASGKPSRCSMYENPEQPVNATTRPTNGDTVFCLDWEYEERWSRESAVSTWNMVCSRHPLISIMIVVQNFGAALCVSAAGCFADRIGRKSVVVPSLVVMLLSTVVLCASTAYPVFAATLFFAAGSNAIAMTVSCLILFEVSVHAHRPLLNVLATTFGILSSDLAMAVLERAGLDWQLRLALFLLPALLVLPAFCFIDESPRWLVAKSKLSEVKTIMLAAAEVNHFPLSKTECLLDRLKADIDAPFGVLTLAEAAMLGKVAIRKHAMIIFACNFATVFGYYVTLISPIWEGDSALRWFAFGAAVFAYTAASVLIRRVTMLTTIIGLLGMLFGLHCLLSITIVRAPVIVSQVLLVMTKALYAVTSVIVPCYSLELFPTAVRGLTACCGFGFCVLGAASAASVALLLNNQGRYEVAFALPAPLLFGSLLALCSIPRTTTVECAKTTVSRKSGMTNQDMEHMKKTLDVMMTTGPNTRRSRSCAGAR
ncbi:solute carrier family 22 member 13-like [Dermacentor andersoni]|uniref:solute carrier family 22 member 13-like n=1 Tax=Dermacentor andersoni TaxID=34620 RepID=UPI003B3A0C10